MAAGPDPPARRPLPKRPRLDRPRLNLLAWLHSTLEPKRRLRLPEGEVSAFVTSIADRLLAGALDDGSSVTGRSLKEFFTRAGPEASLDFLRKRHLAYDVAVGPSTSEGCRDSPKCRFARESRGRVRSRYMKLFRRWRRPTLARVAVRPV